ncbi:hypothetical protein P3T76_013013 [Phytophthora citrophthora]|uniref:Uncharacterized protein n=1 Tax=Phytophthora citrophthora TaxID=4793 RepID=A0AAD9G414_9STRA|nr:hypothetical protein P3T76_013013 [Phytophthora citrophthora]
MCENSAHVSRDHLDSLRDRAADAQRITPKIKDIRGHRSGKQGKIFARTKRLFDCATAKIKNCAKELHF